MGAIQIQCPTCHEQFGVGQEHLNKRARCKKCGHVFVIKAPDLDDTVMGWLSEELAEAKAAAKAEAKAKGIPAITVPTPATPTTPKAAEPAEDQAAPAAEVEAAPLDGLRLSHVDALGAFFLFPPTLLADPAFRASVPRCCLGCGSDKHLRVHLVRWQSLHSDRNANRKSSRTEEAHTPATVQAEDLLKLSDGQLLESLPPIANVPPPYNQPIPYFICDRCSPVGAIMTHIRPDADGIEVCEIGIASLKRGAQFLARNLGRDHDDFKRLDQEIKSGRANPWNSLPLAVRNRIEKWYEADDDERFVCYIRDADFAKAESGQGGLVITDKRMVFQKFASHREFLFTKSIDVLIDDSGGKYRITLSAPKMKPAVLNCDPTVVETIQNTLGALDADYTIHS